jgi:hypothetical protein
MNRTPSKIYLDYPNNSVSVLGESLQTGLQSRNDSAPIPIYFRADDIAVLSNSFAELVALFSHYQIPLCLAVVPAWLTSSRWAAIGQVCNVGSSLWCWHQHGWQHRNHQLSGKNGEFGSDRSVSAVKKDIINGQNKLQEIIGAHFSPFFTPPWNRCSEQTRTELYRAGFKAVSTNRTAKNVPKSPLPDLAVNVDLHTRREPDGRSCLQGLALELESAVKNGSVGMMIHHQRMNRNSFMLLAGLLELICKTPALIPVHFSDLV